MSRAGALNLAGVVLALALSVALAAPREGGTSADGHAVRPEATSPELRIASGSTVVDRLLIELCDRRQILAVAGASARGPMGHRFAGLATIESLDDLEAIVALQPDLLIVNNVADARRVERLREAGIEVLDLGPLEGRASLPGDIAAVADRCGAPARGRAYAAQLERRLDALASDITDRRSAIYLSVYGDRLFGGARGTSYHDVLEAAGLRDAAADDYQGWPQYTVEALLGLDPERIVTRAGMREAICRHAGLDGLRACRDAAGVIEVDGDLLDAPGPGMLEAAEAVYEAAHASASPLEP